MLSPLYISFCGMPLDPAKIAFLKKSLFCHPIILPTIVMLMTLDLTFLFPLAVTQREAYICGWHLWMDASPPPRAQPLTRVNCSSFKAFPALIKILPSSLTTLRWPLLPVNNFTVIPDNQVSFIKHWPSQLWLTSHLFYSGFISPPSSLSRLLLWTSLWTRFQIRSYNLARGWDQYIIGCSSLGVSERKH